MSGTSGDGQTRPTIEEELRLRFGPGREVPQTETPERVLPPAEQLPIVGSELVALGLLVALCDLTIYRGRGSAGYGALFVVAPLLLLLGTVRPKFDRSGWVLAPLLVLLAIRLVWCGSALAVGVGFALLCGFAMSLSGLRPYVLQAVVFAGHLISAGHRGLHHYAKALGRFSPAIFRANWFAIVLPVVTLFAFGTIFVMANPDLVKSFNSGLTAHGSPRTSRSWPCEVFIHFPASHSENHPNPSAFFIRSVMSASSFSPPPPTSLVAQPS